MRIAIISSWPRDPVRGSGTGRYLIDLEAALRRAGATVLAIGADLDLSDYASFVARRMEWNAALPGDTRACSADILLAIDFDGFALPSGRDGFPPKVVSPQGLFAEIAPTEPEPFRSLLLEQARAERRNVADAALLIVPSAYAAEAVQRHYEAGAERIEIIPHGFDLAEWQELLQGADARARDKGPTILSVARLYPRKGIDTLLRAFAGLPARHAAARLRIVGDGIEAPRLRRLAVDLGLEAGDRVRFEGEIPTRAGLAHLFRQADLFCLPSLQESFGFVFLEAMAAGLPVVAARAGAAGEVLGEAGTLVAPGSAEDLTRALARLLDDSAERTRLGEQGRRRASRFHWEAAAAAYLARFERVLGS